MLEGFRKIVDTWVGKALGILLLIGLAGFGVTGLLTNAGSQTLARVGDRDITALDFQRAYNAQLNAMSRQFGVVPTAEQAVASGLPSSVLERLSVEGALSNLANSMGLGVTDERLGNNLRNDPAFGGTLGNFDREVFEQQLQRNGLTENQFFEQQRDAAGREQISLGMFSQIPMPSTALDVISSYANDTRVVDYVILTDDTLLPLDPATDDQLREFLAERQANYRTAETRDIDLLILSLDTLGPRYDVSDAELEAKYEERVGFLTVPERREVQQVVLPAAATVAWFTHGLNAGKSFDELVGDAALEPTSFGLVTRGEITDARLAEAAFDTLGAGEFALVEGVAGTRVVFVVSVEDERTPTLDEVRDEMAALVQRDKARDDYVDVLDQVEELRAAFVAIPDIAEQLSLEFTSQTIDVSGTALLDLPAIGEEEETEIAQRVFAQSLDGLSPTVVLSSNKNVWFDLKSVSESRDQTFEEVSALLAEDWMVDARRNELGVQAGEIAEALNSGEEFDILAVTRGLIPQTSLPFPRSGAGGEIDAEVAQMTFSGGVGYADSVASQNGAFLVFQVREVIESENMIPADQVSVVETSFRESMFLSFSTAVVSDAGMQLNEPLLLELIGLAQPN